ncbi:unnamed protein product [Microthlaspi erraticum]|uniref:Uncharacterized protein n=1 Tax=Microthlaspi erraticum TaxID=1685480 RepID=A0A6D2ITC7_9BRAS|nr:unnamed protein product [Microthlaspi erraticum]
MTFRGKDIKYVDGGQVMAKKGCWSLLKGGLTVDFSVHVNILFQSTDLAAAEILVENVRLQRFNKTQWRLKQDQVIEKGRKVRFQVSFQNKSVAKGSLISLKQIKPSFLLGCAMNYKILESDS